MKHFLLCGKGEEDGGGVGGHDNMNHGTATLTRIHWDGCVSETCVSGTDRMMNHQKAYQAVPHPFQLHTSMHHGSESNSFSEHSPFSDDSEDRLSDLSK